MKKSTFYTLIVIAAIALAGLIGVQAFWINNAYGIKEQQFAQLVNTTLNNITKDVQSYEVIQVMRGMEVPHFFQRNINPRTMQKSLLDTIIAGNKHSDSPAKNDINDNKEPLWNSSIHNYLPNNGMVRQNISQLNAQFNNGTSKMQISSSSISMMPQTMTREQRRAVREMITDATVARLQQCNFNLEDRIDAESLNYIISSEMAKSNIVIPYEYAIYGKDCKTKIYQSIDFNPKKDDNIFRTSLFPFDWLDSSPCYLNIYFPRQGNYLFKTIGLMSFSSIIFTLIVIFTFSITIIQMLRQKKITSIRTDFVNNVTHELKTPISTISLASQMLNDKTIPNESKNYDHLSSVIADESRRLSQQVEKILQMAIFDRGRLMIKYRAIDVHKITTMVVRNMLLQVKNKNGQINTTLNAANPVVEVDEVHFTNVMFNLIDNAIKYSGGKPEITVSTSDTPERLSIAIQDKGIGISKTDQKRIFDQFYRVSTGNVHNVKGFGLGLAYVKNVITAHGGTIEIDSEQGHGTRFTIHLRRHQSAKDKLIENTKN